MKQSRDFTPDEKRVIAERRRYQSAQELAAVFGTTARVISNIVRYS